MKRFNFINAFFAIIGVFVLWLAVDAYTMAKSRIENSIRVSGTVIDFSVSYGKDSGGFKTELYTPIVEFETLEGEFLSFTSIVSSESIDYSIGSSITVLYLPDNPSDAKINDFTSLWGWTAMLTGVSALFFFAAFYEGIFNILTSIKGRILKLTGIHVKAELNNVLHYTDISIKGKSPYRISVKAAFDQSSEVRKFTTREIWFDPKPYLQQDVFSVYVSRLAPSRYYVDTSFLPRKG